MGKIRFGVAIGLTACIVAWFAWRAGENFGDEDAPAPRASDAVESSRLAGAPTGASAASASFGGPEATREPAGVAQELAADAEEPPERRHVHGLVVDDGSGEPVPSAVIAIESDGSHARVETDRAGKFALPIPSGAEHIASVRAAGRAFSLFALRSENESASNPIEIRLDRGASLVVDVRASDGPSPSDALVEVSAVTLELVHNGIYSDRTPRERWAWEAHADREGRARFEQLPAGVELTVSARAEGFVETAAAGTIRLAPGETRELTLVLARGCRIDGRLADANGVAIAQHEVWLLAAEEETEWLLRSFDRPLRTARTDDGGRFRFDGVSVGSWWIGPRHPKAAQRKRGNRERDDVAPLARKVVVGYDDRSLELELRVDCGRFIEGVVLDSRGLSAPGCYVSAAQLPGMGLADATSDDEGRFWIGPLPAGQWMLDSGINLPEGETESIPIAAEAGEHGVVIRLRRGVALGGLVVDREGRSPSVCQVHVDRLDDPSANGEVRTPRDGRFHLTALTPGVYRVIAHTTEGLIGFTPPIELAAGESADDVRVELVEGARLELRYEGPLDGAWFELLAGDALMEDGWVERGEVVDVLAPPGALILRLYANDERVAPQLRPLTVKSGERVRIDWRHD